MDYEQHEHWSENARLAREEYVQGTLTAEEFLRREAQQGHQSLKEKYGK